MRVAAVDIGTNSTRVLVADVADDGAFTVRERRTVITGLGRGVDATGEISAEGMARTIAVLEEYGAIIRRSAVAAVRAVATSASRDAANRDEFVRRAVAALGTAPEVIPGEEEAALTFRGATGGLAADLPVLVIDPGGGSTEFVLGRTSPEYSISVDIGSVRLTERHLTERPATPEQVETAAQAARSLIAMVRLPEAPATVVGVGGTVTSLAAIALDLPAYVREEVHGSVLTADDIAGLVDSLAALSLPELEAIPSLDPARAPVILGGAVVVSEALRRAGSERLVVSDHGVLLGVALALAARA